jgi:hypothetical protein
MDAYRIEDTIAQASIGMVRGKPIRVDDGRDIELSVVCGSVWITQEHDTRDICLGPGQSFRIERDGATVIEALHPSLMALTPAQGRALRVSMLGAGAAPVPLLDPSTQRKSTGSDAWVEKFWVRLFVRSARPTTAAL